jgi:hypothetical protein
MISEDELLVNGKNYNLEADSEGKPGAFVV